MPDIMLAKRSAHLEACKRLYEAGEFNDNLLPKPRSLENFKCPFLDNLKEEYINEKETTPNKIGSRARSQWYSKKARKSIFFKVFCSVRDS